MSKKGDIFQAIVNRLKTIQTANGYDLTVANVFAEEIPMGLDLEDHEVPAILVLDDNDRPQIQHQCLDGNWEIELQLIHDRVSDVVMMDFVRAVAKCLWANSPTVQTNGEFRSIHPSIYDLRLLSVESDLNMIEANRMFGMRVLVKYRTELWNL